MSNDAGTWLDDVDFDLGEIELFGKIALNLGDIFLIYES